MYNSFIPYTVTIYTVNINHLDICSKDNSRLSSFIPIYNEVIHDLNHLMYNSFIPIYNEVVHDHKSFNV